MIIIYNHYNYINSLKLRVRRCARLVDRGVSHKLFHKSTSHLKSKRDRANVYHRLRSFTYLFLLILMYLYDNQTNNRSSAHASENKNPSLQR